MVRPRGAPRWEPIQNDSFPGQIQAGPLAGWVGLPISFAGQIGPHHAEPGSLRQPSCSSELSLSLGLVFDPASPCRHGTVLQRTTFEHAEALAGPWLSDVAAISHPAVCTLQDLGAASNAGHFLFWGFPQRTTPTSDRFLRPCSGIIPVAGLEDV